MTYLDYNITDAEERTKIAYKYLEDLTPEQAAASAERIADYLCFSTGGGIPAKIANSSGIITDNHMITVNKRECSLEGLMAAAAASAGAADSPGGASVADSIYNHFTNDKNIIFSPRTSITQKDIEEVPGLAALRAEIEKCSRQIEESSGRRAFLLRKQLKEMRQDQYVLKNAYRKPVHYANLIKSFHNLDLSEQIYLDEEGHVHSTGLINLYNPDHISLLLCNYSRLKEDSYDDFMSDTKWIMMDLEDTCKRAADAGTLTPIYFDIIIYKIDGLTNADIAEKLKDKYNVTYSIEYISSLWRQKIPKIIATQAENDYLEWYYTYKEKGEWKKCSRCGKIKLAHNNFFSKNNSAKDHFYSICKDCRNAGYAVSRVKDLEDSKKEEKATSAE